MLSLTSTVVIGCTTATREGRALGCVRKRARGKCHAHVMLMMMNFVENSLPCWGGSIRALQPDQRMSSNTFLPSSASTTDTLSSIQYIPSTCLRYYQRTHKRPAAKQTTFFPQNNQKTNTEQTIKNGCPRRCPCEFSAGLIIRVKDDEIEQLTQLMGDSWVNRPVFSLVSRPGSCSSTLVRTR